MTAKRDYKDEDGNEVSRKKLKKLRRIARRPNRPTIHVKRGSNLCQFCPNPLVSFELLRLKNCILHNSIPNE